MSTTDSVSLPYEEIAAAMEAAQAPGDLTDQLIDTDFWTDEMVAEAGIPIVDVPFVTVGGGIGSFVTVDYLRIAACPTDSDPGARRRWTHPWQTYEYLTRGLADPPRRAAALRLRVAPGQHLGLPLATRCARPWRHGIVKKLARCGTCSPSRSSPTTTRRRPARPSRRWSARPTGSATPEMVVKGQVRMVRGATAAATSRSSPRPRAPRATKRVAYRSQYVHIAVGYPGLKFLPDLQGYRTRPPDYRQVVNAYEPHEHVYEQLQAAPGHGAGPRRRHRRRPGCCSG